MEFIEATAFTRHLYDYLTEDEYWGLQSFLVNYPEYGKVVPGTGGVRKIRWALTGSGKREVENIPPHILRQIAEEIEDV